ncbi:hypothetical protein ACWCPQ_34250 [Nocardia sp. NPDC001965]
MEASSLGLTAGVAVVATGLTAFSTFCPGMPDVLNDIGSPSVRNAMQFGTNAASLATVSVGVVLAYITRSPMPLVFGLALAFAATFAYEIAFRRTA